MQEPEIPQEVTLTKKIALELLKGVPSDGQWRFERVKDKEWHVYQNSQRFGNKWKLIDIIGEKQMELDPSGRTEWVMWLLERLHANGTV